MSEGYKSEIDEEIFNPIKNSNLKIHMINNLLNDDKFKKYFPIIKTDPRFEDDSNSYTDDEYITINKFVNSIPSNVRTKLFSDYWKGNWDHLLLMPRRERMSKQSLIEKCGLQKYLIHYCIFDFDEEISTTLQELIKNKDPQEFVDIILTSGQYLLEPLIQITNECTDEDVNRTIEELEKYQTF